MAPFLVLLSLGVTADPVRFERHDIDAFPGGYQVAVADLNADGRPDVIALSTQADRVDWYEHPGDDVDAADPPRWKRHTIARTPKNIDLAPIDLDGDGRLEIALAAGFYFNESDRGGEIYLFEQPTARHMPWSRVPIAVDPVVHRIRWGDLDGDGRPELVHAPIFGPGSDGARDPRGAHLWAFRPPAEGSGEPWQTWKIDETLTVLHGLWVLDLDRDGRDEVLTASFEGIYRFDFEGEGPAGRWQKRHLAPGAKPADDKPGASRGSSEVAPGHSAPDRPFLAAIEPWHGHQVVVYTKAPADPSARTRDRWVPKVIDRSLSEGHALVVADFDADGTDEIVAGWRGAEGGLALYDPDDPAGRSYKKTELDRGIKAEGAVAADVNLDGRLDLVVIAGRTNNLAWYENKRR